MSEFSDFSFSVNFLIFLNFIFLNFLNFIFLNFLIFSEFSEFFIFKYIYI